MNGFTACGSGARSVPPDPRKRVNFMQGLVLGADELTQESAYLANRSEWLARDLLGYGTVMGLRVSRETVAGGPAVVVGAGTALSPRGRPIRVTLPQAVALNEWLDVRRSDLVFHLAPGEGSPPADLLKLFVVLCYQQCATDNQPGPGEPCRTDETPQIYTRIADDFHLELRFAPPDQRESESVRGLVSWLQQIEIVEGGGGTASRDEFLHALRAAAILGSPPEPGLASPPESLRVRAADVARFFRAAIGVWATELRPMSQTIAPPDDCVLLADVDVPVTSTPDGRWIVDESTRIDVHEERRPFLVPLLLLQELGFYSRLAFAPEPVVSAPAPTPTPTPTPPPQPGPAPQLPFSVVAAGIIRGDETNRTHRTPLFNGLAVVAVTDGEIRITFDGYEEPAPEGKFQYIVKALSAARARVDATGAVVINIAGFDTKGIRLLVVDGDGVAISARELIDLEISIEVTRYPSLERTS